jgi:hypothetical protein
LDGPFSGKTNYPVTKTVGNPWLDKLDKALSTADMPLVMSDTASQSIWLRDNHHDMTLGSRGVIADSKKGGLRRDLSLAFEMDGDAEAENATQFNQQAGEFVGNGDTLSAPQKPAGLPVNERFLWRDSSGTGTPFAGSIQLGKILRGPNWWALRDYANLYKRLSGSGGDYTMPARAYFPNRSTEGSPISAYYASQNNTDTWDLETSSSNRYLYRPARSNYAPVNLGTSFLVSMLAKNVNGATADLAVGLDPLFYFWNPYNRKIKCENLAVTLGTGFPGRVVFEVTTNTGTPITSGDKTLLELLKNNMTSGVNAINFLIKGPLVIEPGEVVIASPVAAPSGGVGTVEAVLGYATDNNSGIIMTKLNGGSPLNVPLDSKVAFSFVQSGNGTPDARHQMDTSLPKGTAITPASLAADPTLLGEQTQHILQTLWARTDQQGRAEAVDHYVSPKGISAVGSGAAPPPPRVRNETVGALVNTKVIYGAHSLLIKPASPGGLGGTRRPYEMFARFNPAPSLMRRDYFNICNPNQICRHVTASSTFAVLNDSGIDFSGTVRNTFWGLSYQSSGSTAVPMSNIPSSPLFSLAAFSNANLSIMGTDPFHAVGNSWSSPLILPSSAYGTVDTRGVGSVTAQDFSWLINDALFDRYTLSGIAPAFTIGGGGYSATGSITDTLTKFFSADHVAAQANPVLRPHLPPGKTAAAVTAELAEKDGYKKMAAYSLIDGVFNVNSTSVAAWTAFLRANRNLAVDYAQNGGSDGSSGSPFPSNDSPVKLAGAKPQWSGFSRLSDAQVSALATRIVAQVKLRGPFMSLSDFINHKMGPVDAAQSYTGALQAALDLEAAGGGSGINAASRAAAGATAPTGYTAAAFNGPPVLGSGTMVTTGIPGDITQADLLLPLAPRLAARSDTFRIRGYGEARTKDGTQILARATCEAVVQRFPEYLDPATDAANNEPWDEASSSGTTLNAMNQKFGRRFKLVKFRWLSPSEV